MLKIHSKITRKLLHRFFSIYTIIFCILASLVLAGSIFLLLNNIRRTAALSVSAISDALYTFERNIQEKAYFLISMDELTELLSAYYQSPNEVNRARINLYLGSFQTADSNLRYIMLDDGNGTVFHSINHSSSGIEHFLQSQPSYQEMYSLDSSYFSPILTEGFSDTSAPYCYFVTRRHILQDTYMITLCYEARPLLLSIENGSQNLDSLQIYNGQRECFYQSGSSSDTSYPDYLSNFSTLSGGFLSAGGYHYVALDSYSSSYIVGTLSLSTLLSRFLILAAVLLSVYFIPLILALLSVIRINDRLLAPIGQLTEEISSFSLGQEPIHIYSTQDEIEDLSRSFHAMTLDINQQANMISQKEREKAVTYYQLLTTQLDPHFIYNTMNIINILARDHSYEDIIRVNTALTRVLRERLNTQNTTFEKIRKEIETLQQYQIIMDYRYHHQVSIEYDIDPSVWDQRIPKNILQPLAENSYYHGLSDEDGEIQGTIGVFIYPVDEELILEISDDGRGFTPDSLQKVLESFHTEGESFQDQRAHIGLNNIYRRLGYLYQDQFSMEIRSEPDCGATIILTLPMNPPGFPAA